MADPTVVRHADQVLRVAQGMAPEGPTALSESIGDSWRRCVRDYSLDPVRIYSPAVISTGDLRGRRRSAGRWAEPLRRRQRENIDAGSGEIHPRPPVGLLVQTVLTVDRGDGEHGGLAGRPTRPGPFASIEPGVDSGDLLVRCLGSAGEQRDDTINLLDGTGL